MRKYYLCSYVCVSVCVSWYAIVKCQGHSEIAEMIMKNSAIMKIDLNMKDNHGVDAFHLACYMGHSEIVEIIMKNAACTA